MRRSSTLDLSQRKLIADMATGGAVTGRPKGGTGETMNVPTTMHAVVTTGHGGLDKLVYRKDVPVPEPAPGES
jgi:hypothetical protein